MNLKRIFGALLTLIGTASLIYAAIVYTNSSRGNQELKLLSVFGVLGIIFFISGIGLIQTTKDES